MKENNEKPGEANDPHDLSRFVEAQNPVFKKVTEELSASRKDSHWMWFVFPQIQGLGSSHMAERFAIASLDEARAYLAHPVLGPRLRRCVELMLGSPMSDAVGILGAIDAVKFRSSLTLFDAAEPKGLFQEALGKFHGGEADRTTIRILGEQRQKDDAKSAPWWKSWKGS